MSTSFLHPKAKTIASEKKPDYLQQIARSLLIAAFGLLPILFIPSIYLPFVAGKTLIAGTAVTLAILAYTLSLLKEGSFSFKIPLPIIGLWLVALATVLSAIFSGDFRDSFFGDGLESYTAIFALLMAITASSMGIFAKGQSAIIKLYMVLIGSSLLLSIFHVTRLIFGPEVLSFGIWHSATTSPVGSWNGLAILYGLVVVLSILALQQLPVTKHGRYIIMATVIFSLLMLGFINFSIVWWILGLVGGLVTLYNVTKHFWKNGSDKGEGKHSLITSAIVVIFAIIFIVGGAGLGGAISQKLGISFVEVRPSASATVEIGKSVYKSSPLFGVGSNRFADAWRLHKDPSINQTIFWNTPFDTGFSYVFTSIINTGVIGLIAWIFFLVSLIWSGVLFLLKGSELDRFKYFIGLSSLVSSIYFWVLSIVYTPPPAILLLAAVTTGIFLVTYSQTSNLHSFTLSASKNRAFGFILIAVAITMICATSYGVYAAGRQVISVKEFNKITTTIQSGQSIDEIEGSIAKAIDLAANDVFLREIAFYRWSELNSLLSISEPGEKEQTAFSHSAGQAIKAAQLAITLDPTDPYNHQLLGQIYGILAVVGVEGANERALESYNKVKELDPQNPIPYLLEANLSLNQKDTEGARQAAERAVVLKSNYSEALFFLAQLDINEGNVDRAIAIVSGLVQLEPQNPARLYQLGILLASTNRLNDAVSAFEYAVNLDPQYANARYFLALGYVEQGKIDQAIEQLKIVKELNASNSAVDSLINQLQTTGKIPTNLTEQSPVTERDSSSEGVTNQDLENNLVTSSNPVPNNTTTEETVIVE